MRIDWNPSKELESGKRRKVARIGPIPSLPLVQSRTSHWTGQPGPILHDPGGALQALGTPLHMERSELGPPLSIHEVAGLIGCSPWTVRQTLIPRGLPVFRSAANGKLIFYRDQVVRWIESQQQGGI